jgi:hypothetical protein
MISEPIGNSSIILISHYVTINNLVFRKMLRVVDVLDKLSFHLLRKDGFGRLWDCDGSLKLATITQRH